jgi:hypothetical protein
MDTKPAPSLRLAVLLALLCAAVAAVGVAWSAWDMFGPSRRPIVQGWDDSFYYFWLPSVVIDHDVDFSNQIAQSHTLDAESKAIALSAPRTDRGLVANKYPPGWALGSLPFFLAVRAVMPAASTGFEPPYLLAVWAGQLLYAIAGLWLARKIVGRYCKPGTAWIAVLAAWLASPLVYYQSARLSMSHSQVFALFVVTSWLALRILDGDARLRTWATLGFAAALLIVTRNLAVVYLVLPAWVALKKLRSFPIGLAVVGGVALPITAQLLAWRALYGSWLAYSYGGERFDFGHLHLLAILFSPQHGWFYWQPLLLVGIASFAFWAWPRPEGRMWLASLAIVIVLNAAWPTWWLGSSFGHRGFEAATLFAMIGLAVALERAPVGWSRRAGATVIVLAIGWNLALFALYLTGRISHEEPVTYARAAQALATWLAGGP